MRDLFVKIAILYVKWGKGCSEAEVIDNMPLVRRTLFRGALHERIAMGKFMS